MMRYREWGEMMKNPNWHEGEIMLVLDLYLNKDIKWLTKMSNSTKEIIGLSKLLNALDFYEEKPNKFRSPGAIRMRLANFMSLDGRYKRKAMDNGGHLVKEAWHKYSNDKEKLHLDCVDIVSTHVITKSEEVIQYIYDMGLEDKSTFDPNFSRFVREFKRALSYYAKLSKNNSNINHSHEVYDWCNKVNESINWIDQVESDIVYCMHTEYREHAGINMVPIVEGKSSSLKEERKSFDEEKIGKLIRRTFEDLVEQDKLSTEMIENLLSAEYSRNVFGLKLPFLVSIDENREIRSQLFDANGYVRYWTKPIVIRGLKYCISKEWYKNQRERYLKWFSSVNVKPLYMISSELLKRILNDIKALYDKKVCFSKKDIYKLYDDKPNIEATIEVLIERGVLSGFQGSTQELVIDDYDLFFEMLHNTENYTTE